MGNLTSRVRRPAEPRQQLIMLGLDAAGKTTILHKIVYGLFPGSGDVSAEIPTIAFNIEKCGFQGTFVVAWDVGGRGHDPFFYTMPKRLGFFKGNDGIFFVVDSNDLDRLEQVKDELCYIFKDKEHKGKPVLIWCNKQDLPNALPPTEIMKKLALPEDGRKVHAIGCIAKQGNGLEEGLDWMNRAIEENKKESKVDSEDDDTFFDTLSDGSTADKLNYDTTEGGGNVTLQHFSVIKKGTECPFAKSAKLWGGSPYPPGSTLEDQAKANVAALTEFVQQSQEGADLDGFCIELDDTMASNGGPKEVGECVRRMLTTLSDHDPAGEHLMSKKYIGSRGWRFRFNGADFFITTFAPCYPSTSSRYAFGAGRAFLLLQPQVSFARHGLPLDTPHTHWDAPQTVRDKTRVAFRKAGRGYYIPNTTRYPPAEHIVRPLQDDGNNVVRWWEAPAPLTSTEQPKTVRGMARTSYERVIAE